MTDTLYSNSKTVTTETLLIIMYDAILRWESRLHYSLGQLVYSIFKVWGADGKGLPTEIHVVAQCFLLNLVYTFSLLVFVCPNQVACRIFHISYFLPLQSIFGVGVMYPTMGHPGKSRAVSGGKGKLKWWGEKLAKKMLDRNPNFFLADFFCYHLDFLLPAQTALALQFWP